MPSCFKPAGKLDQENQPFEATRLFLRYCFACAREGQLPKFMAGIHPKYNSPQPSILVMVNKNTKLQDLVLLFFYVAISFTSLM